MKTKIEDKDLSTILTERGEELYNIVNASEKYKNRYLKHSYRQLKSKKNTVAYVFLGDKPCILKWYPPGFVNKMEIEYKFMMKGSSGTNIPTIYEKDMDNNILVISYINGENLCDVINNNNTILIEKKRLIYYLAEWFKNFHNYFKKLDYFYIRGDSTLRNFLLTDRIWGVDFEESRKGKPVEDIAGMCSSILTTDPIFTKEKFQLCEIFIKSYLKLVKWNILEIWDEISYDLLKKIQWRPKDEKILREYSNKIRNMGLQR
jgi:tRNA A-37 threonylcarbamoyl transferase component Bud32